jgi:hypothetical protein
MSVDPDRDMLALPAEAKSGGPKMWSGPPCYSGAGWLQWPDDEAYSFQFMRMLGATQEGASTISERFFRPLERNSYSIGCGENSARPNALSRAWKMCVTAPEHDADPNERLVGYVRRCPHRDGVYFRIWENEL